VNTELVFIPRSFARRVAAAMWGMEGQSSFFLAPSHLRRELFSGYDSVNNPTSHQYLLDRGNSRLVL
jgi:hypothetical protein